MFTKQAHRTWQQVAGKLFLLRKTRPDLYEVIRKDESPERALVTCTFMLGEPIEEAYRSYLNYTNPPPNPNPRDQRNFLRVVRRLDQVLTRFLA